MYLAMSSIFRSFIAYPFKLTIISLSRKPDMYTCDSVESL